MPQTILARVLTPPPPNGQCPNRGATFFVGASLTSPSLGGFSNSISQGDADTDFVLRGMEEDGVHVSPACPRFNFFAPG